MRRLSKGKLPDKEKAALQILGNFYLRLDDNELAERLNSGAIIEIEPKEEEHGW